MCLFDVLRVKALLENGAYINATDIAGWTALMFAASKDSICVLEALIKGGKINHDKGKQIFLCRFCTADCVHCDLRGIFVRQL